MLISKELTAAINEEIGLEFFASHQYTEHRLRTSSRLALKQAGRHVPQAGRTRSATHALKFVQLPGRDRRHPSRSRPSRRRSATFKSVEEAVQSVARLGAARSPGSINALMALAIDQKDYAAQDFLRWFVTEQVEEVATMDNLLQVVKAAGERNLHHRSRRTWCTRSSRRSGRAGLQACPPPQNGSLNQGRAWPAKGHGMASSTATIASANQNCARFPAR